MNSDPRDYELDIRSADIAGLATEVRDHDPLCALDGGTAVFAHGG